MDYSVLQIGQANNSDQTNNMNGEQKKKKKWQTVST
jgi:hypothetical protein